MLKAVGGSESWPLGWRLCPVLVMVSMIWVYPDDWKNGDDQRRQSLCRGEDLDSGRERPVSKRSRFFMVIRLVSCCARLMARACANYHVGSKHMQELDVARWRRASDCFSLGKWWALVRCDFVIRGQLSIDAVHLFVTGRCFATACIPF